MTNVLYQHGTLGTLMAGLLQGTASINDLLKHGDIGIATLTGSDGQDLHLIKRIARAINLQQKFMMKLKKKC